MDITMLYTRAGKVMAAQLTDGNESYPVLIDALGNDVILPQLIESGWHLTSLPLTLNKNGVDLMSLPKSEWTTDLESRYGQDMYDMLGTPMPMEERRKLIHHVQTSSSFKEGEYKITTREQFITYLDSIKDGVPDEDYMPLNFIVHPNARFSIDEYLKNHTYANIINSRRKLSYTRYKRLCGFLKQHGMPAKFNDVDFLRAYLQWGVDGVQFSYKGNPEVGKVYNKFDYVLKWSDAAQIMEPVEINTYTTRQVFTIVVRTETGMRVIPPVGYTEDQLFNGEQLPIYDYEVPNPRCHFKLTMDEDANVRSLIPGEATVVKRKVVHPYNQWLCACEHPIGEIIASYDTFRFGQALKAPGISISTPSGSPMPTSLIGDEESIRVSGFTMSVSQLIADKRRIKTDASLYKALRINGYSDYSALMYFITTNGYYDASRPAMLTGSDGNEYPIILNSSMVDVYLKARNNPEHYDEIIETMPVSVYSDDLSRDELVSMVADMFSGVLDGAINNARMDEAFKQESAIKAETYYSTLRAITMCTSTSIEDIYAQVKNWEAGKPLVINFDGGHITMDGSKFDMVQREYENQVRIIRYEHVMKAPYFVWVDGIVKEFGDRSRDGHIGFYGTVLEAGKKATQAAMAAFADIYADTVMAELAPLKLTDPIKYERMAYTFLHVPGERVLAEEALADTPMGRGLRRLGVAQFFAASSLMQAIKQGMFRMSTPANKGKVYYVSDFEGLQEIVDSCRKCLVANGSLLYCDNQSFCDHVIDDAAFSIAQFYYTVNATITPEAVHPRINYKILVYDPAPCYLFSAHVNLFESGSVRALPCKRDQVFYAKAEMRGDDGSHDLLYATLKGRLQSSFREYMSRCYSVAMEWKKAGSTTRLGGFTPVSSLPEVEPIDSFETVSGQVGLPCFNPGGWDSYFTEYSPDSISVQQTQRDVHFFTGVTCEEYAAGVSDFEPPAIVGHRGIITVQGDTILTTVFGENNMREINASDVATLDQKLYPVKHLYGSRYVFRTVDGRLYYVEV